MAVALADLGLEPGDRVGIISRNCAHWVLADLAIILAGLVSVPVYPTANARTIQQILEHSEASLLIVGKIDDPEEQLRELPKGLRTLAMPYDEAVGELQWESVLREADAGRFQLQARDDADLATLLYTSGSTGAPKGAMHSHGNFSWVGQNLPAALGVQPGDRVLSYLPLSHCTERAYVEASSFYSESTLYFVESIETFMEDLAHARPTLFGSVPRLWKKFQIGVLEKLPQRKLDRLLGLPLIGGLVKRKIKRGLGLDQARWFASGSAPIAVSLLEWWDALDVPIHEGWGMTETFAYGTSLPAGKTPKYGTIGQALPGVELDVSDAQELLIRCPCLMQGYYKADEATAEAMTDDGFFHTGDQASVDDEGWVHITGRVKEQFKTTKGKYIAPVPIESLLARNDHIELACVLGTNLSQPSALIQLAETAPSDRAFLEAELEATRRAVNLELEPHERLGQLIVIKDSWEPENGMLTPTLKLKRQAIEARYGALLDRSKSPVVFEQDL
ncbi:AMP-dependent synthetase [Wenzhouxiangella marina]|uniref:AMP-dependent synthetase n=2 Tax=Wenzhouxiangella marina TaxID=1579979 RepID=A0A0K0XW64_9GAMM|nr:AMP-dependent synthetase [Wenzhouxiangella marina]